jgi:hypothetical protein
MGKGEDEPQMSQEPPQKSTAPEDLMDVFAIYVTCHDESHQSELLEKFVSEGIECKAII